MVRKEILMAYKEGKITAAEVQERLHALKQHSFKSTLSEGQKSLWILQKSSPGLSAYNIPHCFRIYHELDIEKFEQACRFILVQYPILTSVFGEDSEGVPYQSVHPLQSFALQQEDISTLEPDEIIPYLRKKTKEPFSLELGPLMRIHLLLRSEQEHILLITIHHIIFDGSSALLLIRTLLDAYQDLVRGKKPEAVALSTSYGDFVQWEQRMLSSNAGEEHGSYWKQQLSGTLPILNLPTDRPRPSVQSFKGQTYSSRLSPELTRQIKSFAKAHYMNLSVVFLGIFKVLLHRYTGQDDVIVGMPTMVRPQEHFDSLVGYFVNMIPIRSQVLGEQSFSEFIKALQLTLIDGLDHAAYPFPVLVRELNLPRTQANSPVFQVGFFYQNFLQSTNIKRIQEQYQGTLSIEVVDGIHQEGEYEFVLEVFEQKDGFVLNTKYNPEIFDGATIVRMMWHYMKLIQNIIDEPTLCVDDYVLMSKEECNNIIIGWNTTQAAYPDSCLHEIFEMQAAKTPDAVAAIYEDESLTYRELNEKSTLLAIFLQKQGIEPDALMGICVERSLDMIIGLLGILKAGGAYIPLDPDYPADRLEYMIQDSKVSLILTRSGLTDKVSKINGKNIKAIVLDEDWDEIEHQAQGKALKREVKPNHLAYVIYTSGSTGKPKGTMIEHSSVINRLNWMQKKYPIGIGDMILQKTPFTFDVSVWELFWWCFKGAGVCFLKHGGEKDPEAIVDAVEKYGITTMHFVPSMLNAFLDFIEASGDWNRLGSLRQVFASGEALTLKQVHRFNALLYQRVGTTLHNLYGPTEATVDVSYYDCSPWKGPEFVPIGRPIDNICLYVVDKNNRLQPVGIAGELCIAGDGLARGYLNRTELTAEKFIPNPFLPGARMYRTGDLARWMPDGNIEYLGRIDYQVKIRGFRIELGEIETQLLKHRAIKEAVVVDFNIGDEKNLAAYFVSNEELNISEMRNFLAKSLPDYMIPAYFIRMDKLPLSTNGKMDRKSLPKPDTNLNTGNEYILPRNEVEKNIASLWEEVLHITKVGIRDNFFSLGGDSLKALKLVSKTEGKLSLADLFNNPTIEGMAGIILKGTHSSKELLYNLTPDRREVASKSIVCVPYGGGSFLVYKRLAEELYQINKDYSLHAVSLPGHDFGDNDSELKQVIEIAERCAEIIKAKFSTPVSIYGHCVGVGLALEIAMLLEKDFFPVEDIYLGGALPPHFKNGVVPSVDPWESYSDIELFLFLKKIGAFDDIDIDTEEMRFVIKSFRHDVRSMMEYTYQKSSGNNLKARAPIHCVIGYEDPLTNDFADLYTNWEAFSDTVNLYVIRGGGHYFVKTHAGELAKIINSNSK